jgi:hypothetical protein
MAARKNTAAKIYQLHVELEYIEPLIWRRILVTGNHAASYRIARG